MIQNNVLQLTDEYCLPKSYWIPSIVFEEDMENYLYAGSPANLL